MGREARDGGADVDAILTVGHSGYGTEPYLTTQDLADLSAKCRSDAKIISNIEAFEITDEFDVARLDLSLYGEAPDQKLEPWHKRVKDSHAYVSWLLSECERESNPIMFRVWLDWRD